MSKFALLFYLFSMLFLIPESQCGPAENQTKCLHKALVCNDGMQRRASTQRCLNFSEICNGVKDCQLGSDENQCEREGFTVNNNLISTRETEKDTVIANVTQEACAKLCREEDQFQCIGFQHHFQTSDCRLLDEKFSEKTFRPALRGFWITFQKDSRSVNKLPVGFSDAATSFDDPNDNPDAFEDGFDAVVVEVNFDALPSSEQRKKRQANFVSGLLGSFANIFTGKVPERSYRALRGEASLKSNINSCGIRNVNFEPPHTPNERTGRIINGVTPPPGAYPWQAAIRLKDGDSFRQWCGGAIISNQFVLTAAHCIDHLRRNEFVVVVGAQDDHTIGPEQQVFEVEQFIIHYNYKPKKHGDDIALIKLKTINGQGITFGKGIQPICLPSSESLYQSGTMCSVSGWGLKKPGDENSRSNVLKVAAVPLVPVEACNSKDAYGDQASDGMICAGYMDGGTDSCRGDSGGPLACNIDGQFQLLGLVSWGDGCAAKNKPGVYTKVFYYHNWIQEWSRKL